MNWSISYGVGYTRSKMKYSTLGVEKELLPLDMVCFKLRIIGDHTDLFGMLSVGFDYQVGLVMLVRKLNGADDER